MEALTLRQLLEAVNGTLLGDFDDLDAAAVQVSTDSRSITPRSEEHTSELQSPY